MVEKKTRGEDKCEPTEDAEAQLKKAVIKFKLHSNLMFKGKGEKHQTYIFIVCVIMSTQPKRGIMSPGGRVRTRK